MFRNVKRPRADSISLCGFMRDPYEGFQRSIRLRLYEQRRRWKARKVRTFSPFGSRPSNVFSTFLIVSGSNADVGSTQVSARIAPIRKSSKKELTIK
jgi:hypothetical protein